MKTKRAANHKSKQPLCIDDKSLQSYDFENDGSDSYETESADITFANSQIEINSRLVEKFRCGLEIETFSAQSDGEKPEEAAGEADADTAKEPLEEEAPAQQEEQQDEDKPIAEKEDQQEEGAELQEDKAAEEAAKENVEEAAEKQEENTELVESGASTDNLAQEERKVIYKDPEEEPFSPNLSLPHTSTNVEILSHFYKDDPIIPTMMPHFPNPVNFRTYEEYEKASKQWYSEMSGSTNNFMLPILPSLFMKRSHPETEEIFLPVSDYNSKLRKVPNPIDYKDRLYIQHIAIEGKNIDEDVRGLNRLSGTYFPVKCALKFNNLWNAQLFYPPPNPECFDTYEEFQAAYIDWFNNTSKYDNFPYHPSEFSPKYIKIRTSTQYNSTEIQGKYTPIQDECKWNYKQNILSKESLQSLASFKVVFYLKECFSEVILLKSMEKQGLSINLSQKLKEHIAQFKSTGMFDSEEVILNQNLSNAVIAKSFLNSSQNIFNLPENDKKLITNKFMFYLTQLIITKSYPFYYDIFKNIDTCYNLNSTLFPVFLTKNIEIFNQLAYYFNNISKLPKRHFYTLINTSLSKINSDLSGDVVVFFQVLSHFHLIRILSESSVCFNKKSSDYKLMNEQAYNFIAKFSETSVPIMVNTLDSDNAIIYVSIILLVLDTGFNVIKNFQKAFKKNIFYFFNQISNKSKRSFILLEEYIIYYIDILESLFPYFVDFIDDISMSDFGNLNPLMLSFLSQFVSISPTKAKIKDKHYVFTIMNKLIKEQTNENVYKFIYNFTFYFNQIPSNNKTKKREVIQKFSKLLIPFKNPPPILLKAFRNLILNPSFRNIISGEKEWIMPIAFNMQNPDPSIQKESYKIFRKLFFANSALVMKLAKNPSIRSNLVQGIKSIQRDSVLEIVKLITTISLNSVEADSPKSTEQKNQAGFINLLQSVPCDLIEFAQLIFDANFNLYSFLSTIKVECMKNKKTEWILNLFRKTLNQRTAVKMLFAGSFNKQMERTVNKSGK